MEQENNKQIIEHHVIYYAPVNWKGVFLAIVGSIAFTAILLYLCLNDII